MVLGLVPEAAVLPGQQFHFVRPDHVFLEDAVEVIRGSVCNSMPVGRLRSRSNIVPVFTVDIPGYALINGLNVFPNPVSHHLEISFQQLGPAQTRIQLLDLTGREVAVLLQESLHRGAHKISWDASASGVANGAYFVRLESGGFIETRKIVVMR